MHMLKLIGRSSIFLFFAVIFIADAFGITELPLESMQFYKIIKGAIWVIFVGEMILRFFPSSFESMGCQKQFKVNYQPPSDGYAPSFPDVAPKHPVLIVTASWIALNGAIAALFYCGVIGEKVLFLVSMAYSVCDMICILFFCPFQQWMMKNKCCGTCRIYNWDFIMMFTPMIFIPSFYNTSLFIVSLILFINWEVLYKMYPERFHEETNMCLSCANCEEKLCRHKKTLQKYLKKYRKYLPKIKKA